MTTNTSELNHQEELNDGFTGQRFSGFVPEDDDVLDLTSLGKSLVLEDDRKVDFTRKLAEDILQLPQVPYERGLVNNHVSYLIGCMKNKTFRPELVRLASCVCDEAAHGQPKETKFRMNGQHTCWSLLEMPENYEFPGKVNVARYRAKTAEDMRILYSTLDRAKPRSKGDVVIAKLADTPQFKGLKHSVIKLISEGYGFFKYPNQNERQKVGGDGVAHLMQSSDAALVNVVCSYMTTFSVLSVSWMKRAPVIGAIFATFEKSAKEAIRFWDGVREVVGMTEKNDPRLRLHNALMVCRIRAGGAGRPERGQIKSVSSEQVFHWCINAWNAWRRGDQLISLKALLSAERPKVK